MWGGIKIRNLALKAPLRYLFFVPTLISLVFIAPALALPFPSSQKGFLGEYILISSSSQAFENISALRKRKYNTVILKAKFGRSNKQSGSQRHFDGMTPQQRQELSNKAAEVFHTQRTKKAIPYPGKMLDVIGSSRKQKKAILHENTWEPLAGEHLFTELPGTSTSPTSVVSRRQQYLQNFLTKLPLRENFPSRIRKNEVSSPTPNRPIVYLKKRGRHFLSKNLGTSKNAKSRRETSLSQNSDVKTVLPTSRIFSRLRKFINPSPVQY